jgi:rhomboid protease GluP
MAKCAQCGRQLPAFSFKRICPWCVQHEAAQRGEGGDDAKQIVMPAPWARQSESTITLTQVLFGANVALFVAMLIATYLATGSISMDFSGEIEAHFGANFGPWTLTGQWWRLLTYMFLHGGFLHIAFNMWCLWDLGRLCESLYGRWSFAAIYLITGVAGGLASVAWNPGVLSVGASGAIFGLAGALIASFYLGEFSLPRMALQGTLRSLLFFAGFNLFFGAVVPGIDNACHIGGLVSGLILGALIARAAPAHDTRRAGVLAVTALALVGAALGVRSWRGGPMRMARTLDSFADKDPARGIAQLQAIVRQAPNSAEAHFALAQAYINQEKYPQAEAEFKRVLELQPQDHVAHLDLGMVLLDEKRPEDAKAVFAEMLAQNANDGVAHYGMGLAQASEEKYQPAIDEFKKAAQLSSQISGVYSEMGQAYVKLKLYDEAIAAYLQEKEKYGDDPDLEAGLAEAYQAKGMTQQAEEARSKAEQLRSQHD